MFSRKLASVFLSTISLLVLAVSAQAQTQVTEAPLFVVTYNESVNYVYENGQFRTLDFCQPEAGSSNPIYYSFAPDASQVVFKVASQDEGLATDIYICDLTSREARLVSPEVDRSRSIYRSSPVWSPDGSQLAWADTNQDAQSLEVVIYDLATDSSEVIYEQSQRSLAFLVPTIDWGESGLGFFDVIEQDGVGQAIVVFLDPVTGEAQTHIVEDPSVAAYGRWISLGSEEAFLLRDNADGKLTIMNPESGDIRMFNGRLEFYNRAQPDGLSLIAMPTAELGAYDWVVSGPDFSSNLSLKGNETTVALSPDGNGLAVVTFENYPYGGRAYVMSEFTLFPPSAVRVDTFETGYSIPGVLSIFWGPVGLRLAP